MADIPMREGGCHCGKVRYQVATDLAKVMSCNCSICSKHGLILTFVPEAQFKLLSGEGELQEYLFNKQVIITSSAAAAASTVRARHRARRQSAHGRHQRALPRRRRRRRPQAHAFDGRSLVMQRTTAPSRPNVHPPEHSRNAVLSWCLTA